MTDAEHSQANAARWLDPIACTYFVAAILTIERLTLASIAPEGATLPHPIWQLLFPLAVVGVALFLPRTQRFLMLGTIGVIAGLLLAVDSAYHDFFSTVPSSFMFASAMQLLEVDASVGALIDPADFLFALPFAPFLLLPYAIRRRSANPEGRPTEVVPRPWRHPAQGGLLLAGTVLLAFVARAMPIYEATHHIGRSPWVKPADHWGSRFSRLSYATTFGLFNYHISDVRDFAIAQRERTPLDSDGRARINEALDRKAALNAIPSPLFGIAKGRHVVFIQLESFQHFLLDLEIQGHAVTPNLNRVAREGLRWDYILDVTHIGRTSDAEFAVMSGLLPDVRKPAALSRLSPKLLTLPKQLVRAGYETSTIHGFKPSFWNRADSHPSFGIQELLFRESFDDSDEIGLGPSDRQVFRFAADRLAERRDRPQFQFLISLTSHHPYLDVPAAYLAPYAHLRPQDGYGLIAPYLASASYTDEAVGLYLDRLRTTGLLEDTLIVLYGDHDRGGLGEQRAPEAIGPRMLTYSEDRVPFLILIPGEEDRLARVRDQYRGVMGGLHDVYPTVAHLLGQPVPRGVFGTHLFVGNDRRDALPLPGPAGAFGYRGALSLGRGSVLVAESAAPDANVLPSPEIVFRDRLALHDLLDHYDSIASTWPAADGNPETAPSRTTIASGVSLRRP